jgi:hypothetical protein
MLDSVGTPKGTMQALLGHTIPEITREIYLLAIPKEQRRAIEGVERLVFGPTFLTHLLEVDKGQTRRSTRMRSVVPHPVEKKAFQCGEPYLGTSNLRSYASNVVRVLPYSTKSFTNVARFDAASAFDFRYC